MSSDVVIRVVQSIEDVPADQWNALAGSNPFVQHAFLHAMHTSGCASKGTGWQPAYLLMHAGDTLAGAMPLYVKSHSRGEYVFDHAWADAFARHGLRYYPKLLSAVPFSPVTGPRLLARTHADRVALARGAIAFAKQLDVSSIHVLFTHEDDLAALTEAGYMLREGVQFHWENQDFATFDDFLAQMNQEKRKKLRQDRRRVREAGVTYRWLRGADIDDAALDFFLPVLREHLPRALERTLPVA